MSIDTPTTTHDPNSALTAEQEFARNVALGLFNNITKAIRGKDDAIKVVVAGLISGGHILLEDSPGVGKTLLAKSIAASIDASFGRIQGTPDLLPSDITGSSVFHRATEQWEFRPGPLFNNVVLFDELNRATPRTQSALLEPMEEGHATIDGETRSLPSPWICIATQNPSSERGTFEIPQSQLDRFGLSIGLGLADREAEREILTKKAGTSTLQHLTSVANPVDFVRARRAVDEIYTSIPAVEYILDIMNAVRNSPYGVQLGTRATVSLLQNTRAVALMNGRGFVTPDDVRSIVIYSLAHRLKSDSASSADKRIAVWDAVVSVPTPRV